MRRILVVERDAITRDSVSEFLRTFDYTVDTAASHREARHKIRCRRPDLILLDVHTAPAGGRGFVDEYRSGPLRVADMLSAVRQLSEARSRGLAARLFA